MLKLGNNCLTLIAAGSLAGALVWTVSFPNRVVAQGTEQAGQTRSANVTPVSEAVPKAAPAAGKVQWAASAPGRVEPRDGETRVVSQMPGKIAEVVVSVNDRVRAGDLLFRLDDEDHQARVAGAEAEVAVRTRERDQENVGKLAKDRRNQDDVLARAERALFATRFELDRVMAQARSTKEVGAVEIEAAREAVKSAVANLAREREAHRKFLQNKDLPLPTRLESGLTVARSDLAVAESMLSRTRVRAPVDGTVLVVNAKVGEMAAPNHEQPMVVIGDLSTLRVRAEFDERDIDKVRVGQSAVVTSDAFPNRQFEGRVTQVAKSLGPPRVSQRGPRRPNDVDVLEVFVEIEGQTPLLSGMRADVFLRTEAATADAQPKSN